MAELQQGLPVAPGTSTGLPSRMRRNMRCSRAGIMLCGPKTIENAALVALEQLDHEFNIFRLVCRDVLDHVPFGADESGSDSVGLAAVSDEAASSVGYRSLASPAVQHRHIVAQAHEFVYQRQAIEVCPTHDENFHAHRVGVCLPCAPFWEPPRYGMLENLDRVPAGAKMGDHAGRRAGEAKGEALWSM